MPAFTQTDGWVLFSIGFGKNGSTIRQIISNGDMLNHAIITQRELETSLNKLLHNGYIRYENKRFFATDQAILFYQRNKKLSEGCIAEWLRISDLLLQQPAKPDEINVITIPKKEKK